MMKRIVKGFLRFAWRLTLPVRRPFQRRLADFVRRSVAVNVHNYPDVMLNQIVIELIRLQEQVQHLQATVDELASDRAVTDDRDSVLGWSQDQAA